MIVAKLGGAWGAAAGVAVSLISTAITWGQKAHTLSLEQGLETTQQNLASQRVTYSGSRYPNVTEG